MSVQTVLVVDDSPFIQRSLSMKLRASGFDTLTAHDGATAVSTARLRKPDLILLDLNFPPDVAHGGGVPWDGILIMAWLRRLEEAKDIPVVVITGTNAAKERARALEAGAVGFFQKPINPDQLMTMIRGVLDRKPGEASASQTTVEPTVREAARN